MPCRRQLGKYRVVVIGSMVCWSMVRRFWSQATSVDATHILLIESNLVARRTQPNNGINLALAFSASIQSPLRSV